MVMGQWDDTLLNRWWDELHRLLAGSAKFKVEIGEYDNVILTTEVDTSAHHRSCALRHGGTACTC